MKILLRHTNRQIYRALLLVVMFTLAAAGMSAGTLVFADQSRLASGRWVKISVENTGLHRITASQLSSMGFSDPSKVKVYGYGGLRISDKLSTDDFIDDLPQVSSVVDDGGIVFFANGTVRWSETSSGSGKFLHSRNPFSYKGYYYLSDSDDERLTPAASPYAKPTTLVGASETFRERLMHHQEKNSFGTSGFTFFGESFLETPNVKVSFDLPDLATGEYSAKVWARIEVGAKSQTNTVVTPVFSEMLTNSAGNNTFTVSRSDGSSYIKGRTNYSDYSAREFTGNKLDIDLSVASNTPLTCAYLHYIDLSYERNLTMSSDVLPFRLLTAKGALSSAKANTLVWDVTDPNGVIDMATATVDGKLTWQNSASGLREYVAWVPGTKLPQPTVEGRVANQNLHAEATPDMVIFTLPEWRQAADALADYRRKAPSNLKVLVVDVNDVYNEFSSGVPDVQAFRKMLKMFYDREDSNLQYALFIGRGTWDYRRVTQLSRQGLTALPVMPMWQTLNSTDQFNLSWSTDDLFGFLDDNTSSDSRNAYMRIAVGRFPVTNLPDAMMLVEKIKAYEKSAFGSWRNKLMVVSDGSADALTFMRQCDNMVQTMRSVNAGSSPAGTGYGMIDTKVYLEAYSLENGQTVKANEEVRTKLSEGVAWLTYIGHGNTTSWGGLGVMPLSYVQQMSLRRKPIVLAATCDYGEFDVPAQSAAEAMLLNQQGPIAVVSTTRSAAVTYNGDVTRYVGESLAAVNNDGKPLTMGQVIQRAKNRIVDTGLNASRANAFRFVVMGDPALRHVVPTNGVQLTGMYDVTEDRPLRLDDVTPPHVPGGSRTRFSGIVCDALGQPLTDFNGEIVLTLYDALYDITTLGREANEATIELQGGKLTTARTAVKNGEWECTLQIPLDIANNNTPAALEMYAVNANSTKDAVGVYRDFTVSDFTDIMPDKEAPVIKKFYLNQPHFSDGDLVDTNPTVFAELSDNVSINISESGVGHNMALVLDDNHYYTDVANYFLPDFGACTSGTLTYALKNLTSGEHKLTLKVWDTSDNPAEATLTFNVDPALTPSILNVYTDTNPASEAANFYVVHDRPDKDVLIGIEIFDLMGKRVWHCQQRSFSDGNYAEPITWDLSTGAGSRVSNGVYLYRATLRMPSGETYSTKSHKIAVMSAH